MNEVEFYNVLRVLISSIGYALTKGDDQAEAVCQRVLNQLEEILGPDQEATLDMVGLLGTVYGNLANWPRTETMLRQVLAGEEKLLGLNHPSTLKTALGLGFAFGDQGKVEEAESKYRQILTGILVDPSNPSNPDNPVEWKVINNLGTTASSRGDLQDAEARFREAYGKSVQVHGVDHSEPRKPLFNLAGVKKGRRDIAGAA